jgi:co-chaperonin GroES (HSP10)
MENTMDTTDTTEIMDETGYINWYSFAPVGDTFIVKTLPDKTKKESESGIIITTQTDIVTDRPFKGMVVSVGPDAKYKIGDYLYWQPQSGFDLAMIKPTEPDEKFLLLHNDAILGQLVKDTRTTRVARTASAGGKR